MLYTKNGSIPQPETDGTEGWIPAPDKPECPEGKEVVWLNWEWVIRDPRPADRPGYQWNWRHDTKSWVEGAWPATGEGEIGEIIVSGNVDEITLSGNAEANLGTTSISSIETIVGGQ
jgi:hypothetical protein